MSLPSTNFTPVVHGTELIFRNKKRSVGECIILLNHRWWDWTKWTDCLWGCCRCGGTDGSMIGNAILEWEAKTGSAAEILMVWEKCVAIFFGVRRYWYIFYERLMLRDIIPFKLVPCKNSLHAASTLTHHDDFSCIVRNLPTTQKPSQIWHIRSCTIHRHIHDNNNPSAITSNNRIFGEPIPPPPYQFCYTFCRGMMFWKIDLFPIGKSFNVNHLIPCFEPHSTSISPWSVSDGHSKALAPHC
jgi:hypothetical protein